MASFQYKIGWKRPRKTENKNHRSVPFRSYPALNRKLKKNSKKIKKIKKHIMDSYQVKIGWKRMRQREIKMNVPFLSYPTRNRKFQ